jgi:hypothetical protein
MADLDATMAGMGLGPGLSAPVSATAGAGVVGTKIVGSFHSVNNVIQNMVSGLTKVVTLLGKANQTLSNMVKVAGGRQSALGGSMFGGTGGVGGAGSMGLGLASVSSATSTGALTSRLGTSGAMPASLGTFGGNKFFSALGGGGMIASGVGGIISGAARMGLGAAGAVYAALPSTQDVLARNRLLFNASLTSAMGPNAVGSWATSNTMRMGVSNLDAFQAANTLGTYGYGAGTSGAGQILRQSAGLSLLTGQSINNVAGTLGANLTNGSMSNNLRILGINTTDRSGNSVGFNNLAGQIYQRFGFSKLNTAQATRELQPGKAGAANLEYYIQDPNLRSMIEQYILLRAKNGGKEVDLGGSNVKGVLNGAGIGQGVLGAESAMRGLQSSEADKINAFAEKMSKGIEQGADAATKLNDLMSGKAGLLGSLAQLKGALDTFGGSKPGQGVIAGASTALGGFMDALKGAVSVLLGIFGAKGLGSILGKTGSALSKGAGGVVSAVRGAAGAAGRAIMGGARAAGSFLGTVLTEGVSVLNIPIVLDQNMPGLNNSGSGPMALAGSSSNTAQGGGAGSGGTAAGRATGTNANALIAYAERFIGTPYHWGGTSPSGAGWDCSGFVQYVFKRQGINLPRTSQEQYLVGTAVQYRDAQPGDLLFFHYRGGQAGANHVGIFIGNGKMIAAQNPRVGTGIHAVDTNNLIGVRRVLKGSVGRGAKPAATSNSNSLNSSVGTSMLTVPSTMSLSVDISGISATSGALADLLSMNFSVARSTGAASSGAASGGTSAGSAAPAAVSGPAPRGAAQSYAQSMLGQFGWGGQWPSLLKLWTQESSWNANAVNSSSGAYGIPQALPAAQGHPYALGDYKSQINWGLNYIKGRYGSPNAAWQHEVSHNWYSQGAWNIAKDQLANIHQGEMIIPASVAQSVRESIQSSMTGNRGGGQGGTVNINVTIQNASDAEAVAFANKVKAVLDGRTTLASIGAN